MQKVSLNMCKEMFITSGRHVYISSLVHIFYITSVAKKVTLTSTTHINTTATPQVTHPRVVAVNEHPVRGLFSTLSTDTTTTIFKLVTRRIMEQKNSSLTIRPITIYN